MSKNTSTASSKKRVIVVGGGMAGLAAAYELAKQDAITVQLFESNDYLGGRVRSLPVNRQMVDFGGFIIYPWYQNYNRIIEELQLKEQIERVALKQIYYEMESGTYTAFSDIKFPLRETAKVYPKLAWPVFQQKDLDEPDLDVFDQRTVSEHYRHILESTEESMLERYTNIVAQGYCYGAVDKYKMAFLAPIIRFNYMHGDIRSSYFFRYGNYHVPEAMAGSIETNGGSIHLNSPVTQVSDRTITVNGTQYSADAIVFAQTVDASLYSQILPDTPIECEYTHFYTLTVETEQLSSVNGNTDWGAAFYEPVDSESLQVLSAINMGALYSNRLANYINLNIIVRDSSQQLSQEQLFAQVETQLELLFPGTSFKRSAQMKHWEQTMPVAQERFVQQVRAAQGKNGYFFAGDFMGGPSMEVATTTGVKAAERVTSYLS